MKHDLYIFPNSFHRNSKNEHQETQNTGTEENEGGIKIPRETTEKTQTTIQQNQGTFQEELKERREAVKTRVQKHRLSQNQTFDSIMVTSSPIPESHTPSHLIVSMSFASRGVL